MASQLEIHTHVFTDPWTVLMLLVSLGYASQGEKRGRTAWLREGRIWCTPLLLLSTLPGPYPPPVHPQTLLPCTLHNSTTTHLLKPTEALGATVCTICSHYPEGHAAQLSLHYKGSCAVNEGERKCKCLLNFTPTSGAQVLETCLSAELTPGFVFLGAEIHISAACSAWLSDEWSIAVLQYAHR